MEIFQAKQKAGVYSRLRIQCCSLHTRINFAFINPFTSHDRTTRIDIRADALPNMRNDEFVLSSPVCDATSPNSSRLRPRLLLCSCSQRSQWLSPSRCNCPSENTY